MIESVSRDEIIEPAPARKPRALTPDQKEARNKREREARAAKSASKAPRAKVTKPRSARAPSLKTEIAAFLTLTNTLVIMSPLGTRPVAAIHDPAVDVERRGDELDEPEINALAGALDAQCRRSPRFRKYVESVLTVGAGGQLVTVLGIIATRRAARHNVIPGGVPLDFALGMMIANGDTAALGGFTPTEDAPGTDPETLETPPAPLPDAPFDFDK
jgi:hypothetical protein